MSDIKQYEPLWGAWYVDSFIGEGSYGKVYRVRREEFGKTYYSAVKIISIPQSQADVRALLGEGMDEASSRSYFHAFVADIVLEIDLMSEFRGNSNIVSFEDHKVIEKTGEIGWDILIRMELLTSLSDYVMDRPFSQEEIIKLGVHICRALELCAIKKTIHRDIKPDNIFVSQYGDYKLGDFGIARQIERTASGLSKKGTYSYMAPEVFKGDEYGANVDMYSLGIVLYRLLNHNRTPFLPEFPAVIKPSDRDKALQLRMGGEPLPPIKGADPALNAVILKACDYNRKARFSSPTAMREALEAISGSVSYAPVSMPVQNAPEHGRLTGSVNPYAKSAKQKSRSEIADDPANATEGIYTNAPSRASHTPKNILLQSYRQEVSSEDRKPAPADKSKKLSQLQKIVRIAVIPAALFFFVVILLIVSQFNKGINTLADTDAPPSSGYVSATTTLAAEPAITTTTTTTTTTTATTMATATTTTTTATAAAKMESAESTAATTPAAESTTIAAESTAKETAASTSATESTTALTTSTTTAPETTITATPVTTTTVTTTSAAKTTAATAPAKKTTVTTVSAKKTTATTAPAKKTTEKITTTTVYTARSTAKAVKETETAKPHTEPAKTQEPTTPAPKEPDIDYDVY